jgi:hypothetical protein
MISFCGFSMFFSLLCFLYFVRNNPLVWLNWAINTLIDFAVDWLPSSPENLKVKTLLLQIDGAVPAFGYSFLVSLVKTLNTLVGLSLLIRAYKLFNPFK